MDRQEGSAPVHIFEQALFLLSADLADIGVDYVQGYGVEKPRPLDTLSLA